MYLDSAMMKRLWLSALLLAPSILFAQQTPDVPQYFVRYQRVYAAESLCILVREDGAFHLEKESNRHSTPYEGILPEERLSVLRGLVSDSRIYDLQQAGITADLITDEVEAIQLSVNTPAGWHNLVFPTSGSIHKYRTSLDPLVKWADSVRKLKVSRLEDQSVTHCLPPGLAVRTAASPGTRANPDSALPDQSTAAKQSRRPFLFHFSRDHFYGGRVERTCVVAYPSGRYHLEKRSQDFGSTAKAKVYEGEIPAHEVDGLRALLDNPELVNAVSPAMAEGTFMGEGEILMCAVPRDNLVQNLLFHRFFRVIAPGSQSGEAGGKSGLRYRITDARVLDPLQKWIKDNLEKAGQKPLDRNDGNDCLPTVKPVEVK